MSERAGAMWFTVAILGMLPGAAYAWDTSASIDLDATASDVRIVLEGSPRLLVTGPAHTWLIDPKSEQVVDNLPLGAHAVAETSPGTAWLCNDTGVHRLDMSATSLGKPTAVDSTPCKTIAHYKLEDTVRLVVVGKRARIFEVGAGNELKFTKELDSDLGDRPLLATDKRRFAVSTVGTAQILEEGPWGPSTLAAGGPIGGLSTSATSWVWSLPEEDVLMDVTRTRIAVADAPGPLTSGDVNGDGTLDVVVSHPGAQRLGVVLGGSNREVLVAVPLGVRSVHTADIDGDGCAEVALVSPAGAIRVLNGACASPSAASTPVGSSTPAAAVEPPPTLPTSLVIGETWSSVTMQAGQRLALTLKDERGEATAWAASGGPTGLIVSSQGSALYRALPEHVGRWRVSVRMWSNGQWTRRSGFEIVVKPGDPNTVSTLPNTSVAQVRTPQRRGPTDLTQALGEEVGEIRRPLIIRGCNLGFGGALGFSKVTSSWVMLGEDYVFSGSPALSIGCEGQPAKKMWWSVGVDMAPWFVYLVDDAEMRHGIAATIGAGVTPGEDVRIGLYGTVGSSIIGVGALGRWMPFHRKSGARHGPELRVTWMPSNVAIMEAQLLYNMQIGRFRTNGNRTSKVPTAQQASTTP